ncbi:Sec34-like family-domain-containing protein [Gongronella butleri]|nr:Sec34-like family-domain-containing protein [Gongronella butleri]
MATRRASRTVSLEEWEERTQLNEKQLQSVHQVKEACKDLPLPSSWYFDKSFGSPAALSGGRTPDASSLQHMTPVNAGLLSSHLRAIKRSRSATNLFTETQATAIERQLSMDIGADKPIETLQQFYDWFAIKEKEMEQGQEDIYRNYLSNVKFYQSACVDLLQDLESTSGLFQDLIQDYGFVENQTKSLQSICEQLLREQDHLTHLADALTERLAYFNQLEPIAKALNAPGDDICLQPDFIPMLEKLDECIDYMTDHLNYRDAELYLMRFRQCLTRGMTLIKMYAITTIKNLGYETYKQIMGPAADQSMTLSKQTTLFQVKFRAIASSIKSLTDQVEKRGRGHKEYHDLYKEIIHVYIQTRQQVLSPIITRRILELGATGSDLLTFARQGSAYIMGLCTDEYNLFYSFFQAGATELDGYLELLTSFLHDYIRPRIIHETSIPVLSELCTIFQMYAQQEFQIALGGGADTTAERKEPGFGHLIETVLEDAQTRLVFRAERYIQSDIQGYNGQKSEFTMESASPQDTAHQGSTATEDGMATSMPTGTTTATMSGPATLAIDDDEAAEDRAAAQQAAGLQDTTATSAATTSTSPTRAENSVSTSPPALSDSSSPMLSNPNWYPTLQRTLWLLTKLYRCVQPAVFDDLAQEAITVCITSLRTVSDSLRTNKSRLDGQLFLMKQLLILKEQLTLFEVTLVRDEKTLDFSSMTDSIPYLPTTFFAKK